MHVPTVLALLLLICVCLLIAAASAKADPPDFKTSICAEPAVTGLKVVNDRWPDASSPLQFALDAIRLENAKTDQEKAIAVWLWIRRFTMYTNGRPPTERAPAGRGYVSDPVKIMNVWGADWCDGLSRCMELSWRHLGHKAQKFYKSGHTLCDAAWVDPDGVERYHLFDVSEGWFAFTRDGRVANAEDIARDHSLAHRPPAGPALRTHSINSIYGWVHAQHLPYEQTHMMELQMRPGESFARSWGNVGKPFQDNVGRKGDNVPEEHGPFKPEYGNGVWTFCPDLTEAGLKAECATPPVNCKWVVSPKGMTERDGHLVRADAGKPAKLTYRIRTPYIISSLPVQATGSVESIAVSDDNGKNWRTIEVAQPGQYELAPGTKDGKETSAFGRYDVLVKLTLGKESRLSGLRFGTVVQQNIYALPQLLPGENKITVHGRLDKGQAVRVTYVWDDPAGKDRRNLTVAAELPHTYTINAAGSRWGDVACKSLNIEVVPADGKGSRTEVKEAETLAGKIEPLPSYLVSLGKSPVPAAQTLDEYLAVLRGTGVSPVAGHGQDAHATTAPAADKNELSMALAGIRELAAKAAQPGGTATPADFGKAYEAVREVAMKNLDRPKIEALQVMYWLDRKRAAADFVKIVNETEPAMEYLADVKLDKVDVIEDDRDPKSVRRGHFFNVVAVLSRFLADEECVEAVPALLKAAEAQANTRDEPRRALIRSIGELGDKSAVPLLLKLLDPANPDDGQIVAEALGRIGDPQAAPALRKAADKSDYTPMKRNCLLALGALKDRDSVALLTRCVTHADEDVRGAAATALGQIGDPSAAEALKKQLAAEPVAWVQRVMRQAVEKLAK